MIIDHRHTDLADVPLEWIDAAKSELHIAYGHTSHGSQIITGMTGLTRFANAPHGGSTYAWNNGGTGGALDLADTPFSGAGDLGNPNFTAWATATRSYLDDPANADVNVVMWSWCGQVSSASEANITTYLTLMSGLEEDYPDVRFVYMTGHTDGSGLTGNLHVRNQQIRDYCAANDKILYDFEDIESYDPDGTYFGDRNVTDELRLRRRQLGHRVAGLPHAGGRLVRLRVRPQRAPERQPQGLRCLVALGAAGGVGRGLHRSHRRRR